jgi:hypothetical protein
MPATPLNRYTLDKLAPQFYPEDVRGIGVPLVANSTYRRGQILGYVTTTAANDVWTLTPGGTVSGGSVTLNVYGASVTILAADTASQAQSKINAALVSQYGSGNGVTVTGGPLTSGALVITAAGSFGNQPQTISITSTALTGSSPTLTPTHTTTGVAQNAYAPYASGNSDGTQTARAIMPYDAVTDALGMIHPGSATSMGGYKCPTVAVWTNGGQWNIADLVGLDATAVGQLGQLLTGSVASGVGLLELRG